MARMDRLQMADMRALEQEHERHNPVSGARGGSATPSMGLSMFRGGAEEGFNTNSGYEPKHGRDVLTNINEAKTAGIALIHHIIKLHGAGYAEAFRGGMEGGMEGCGEKLPAWKKAERKYGREMLSGLKHAESNTVHLIHSAMKNRDEAPKAPAAKKSTAASAEKQLEKEGITSKASFRKWALKNHPDKGGDTATFQKFSGLAGKLGWSGGMHGMGHMVGVGGSRTGAYEGEGHCDMEGGGPISGLNIPFISGLAGMFGLGKEPSTPSSAELQRALKKLKGGGAEDVAEMVGGGMKGWLIHKMARFMLPALKYRVWRLYNAGLSRGQYDDATFEQTLDNLPLGQILEIPITAVRNWMTKTVESAERSGSGKLTITHGGTGAGTGGAKVKRVVGENDGRRARAAIVKKVMSEKGLSMIEASKYVKEHGLYK